MASLDVNLNKIQIWYELLLEPQGCDSVYFKYEILSMWVL